MKKTLAVPGGHLAYEIMGEGPLVTLLHPGLWDMRTWDREFERWPSQGLRVLRYDLRGYGGSSRLEPGVPYSHIQDLTALLDEVGAASTALVGCSMGGGIAIDFTLEHADRVWALVAVAPGLGGFEPQPAEEAWWEARVGPIAAAVESGDLDRAQDLRLEMWAPLGTEDPAGARIREIAFDNLHELTMDESGEVELDPPAATRLGEITTPTLIVGAPHDPPHMRRVVDILATGIPGARSVTIEGADHVVNLRQPDAFEGATLPFLLGFLPTGG